jgi:hypothetical protein
MRPLLLPVASVVFCPLLLLVREGSASVLEEVVDDRQPPLAVVESFEPNALLEAAAGE